MKIALYGISRCGKDYLITKIVELLATHIKHFKGSETLRRLAKEKFNSAFVDLLPEQQLKLREALIDILLLEEREYSNIIVDGHYAFPNNIGGFDIVFTNADKNLYDVFVYVNKSPHLIRSNSEHSDRVQWKEYLTDELNIEKWQHFEMEQLKRECDSAGKPFIVVDDDTSTTIEFLRNLITETILVHPQKIARAIFDDLKSQLVDTKEVVLTDCDCTLSIGDITKYFIENAGIDNQKIKNIFKGDHYTIYQFYRMHHYLSRTDDYPNLVYQASMRMIPFEPLISDLKIVKATKIVIAITTGLGESWAVINRKFQFADTVVGYSPNNCIGLLNYYISAEVKGELVKLIRSAGKHVIAFGDSLVDLEMMKRANRSILICNHQINLPLASQLANTPNCFLQPIYNAAYYENCERVQSIWSE